MPSCTAASSRSKSLDDKTFTLDLDRVTFDYNRLDLDVLPAHLEAQGVLADPAEYRHRTLYDTEPTNPGLYMGPYRITKVSPGSYIVLEPNPTWWGQALFQTHRGAR